MTKALKLRRLQFSLRTLLLLVAIAAIGCVVIPPLYRLIFPPKPDFDQLIDIITTTVQANSGGEMTDDSTSLEVGAGQEVNDGPTSTSSNNN